MLSKEINKNKFFFLNLRDNLILIQMIQFDLRDALQRISLKGNNKVLSGVPDTQDLIKKWQILAKDLRHMEINLNLIQ